LLRKQLKTLRVYFFATPCTSAYYSKESSGQLWPKAKKWVYR